MTTPEPTKPGRPRKPAETPAAPTVPPPPGPRRLEVRIDGKIQLAQPIHTYTINQDDENQVIITGIIRLPATSE